MINDMYKNRFLSIENELKKDCVKIVVAPNEVKAIKQQMDNSFFKSGDEATTLMNKIVYLKFMTTLYQKDKSNDKAFEWDEYKKQKLLFELGGEENFRRNLKNKKQDFFSTPLNVTNQNFYFNGTNVS